MESSTKTHNLHAGVYVPVITPFTKSGEIDFVGLKRQIMYLESSGVNGIILAGTTGEGHLLSMREKKALIDFGEKMRESIPRPFVLIAGTGTQNLPEAIEISKYAAERKYDAVLALPPKTRNQKEIEDYYASVGRSSKIPLIAYNIPSLTNVGIEPETIARLVGKTSVIGVKDSAQNPHLLSRWKEVCPRAFLVIGEDTLIRHGVQKCNADALIPGSANVNPKELVSAFSQAREGGGEAAQERVNKLVADLIRGKGFRGNVKERVLAEGRIATSRVRKKIRV